MTLRLTTLTEHPDLDYRKRKIEVETSVYGDDHVFLFLGGRDGGAHVSGPALRDALLEAFPLGDKPAVATKDEPLADWEKELLAGVKPVKQYGSVVRPKPDFVPGTVVNVSPSGRYVILPEGWYNIDHAITGSFKFTNSKATVVFDPRDAVALPSPLGIRVGDRVERTKDGITISFEVGHIGDGTKHLFAKGDSPNFPVAYNPKGFTVTSREVPTRLPAGTITRNKESGPLRGGLCLRLDHGSLMLSGPRVGVKAEDGAQERDVRRGDHEVIYLPGS